MILVMWTQLGCSSAEETSHLRQVALHGVEVEQERGSVDFAQPHQLFTVRLETHVRGPAKRRAKLRLSMTKPRDPA